MAKKVDVIGNFSWASGQTGAKTSDPISRNEGVHQGKMVGFKATASDATNAITYTLEILDSDGDVIYSQASLPKNTTSVVMNLSVPLIAQEQVRITPSGNPGTSGFQVTNVRLYYLPDE